MAFFNKTRRKAMILTFLAMLLGGGAIVAVSFAAFFR
jgi:hypothetical protein